MLYLCSSQRNSHLTTSVDGNFGQTNASSYQLSFKGLTYAGFIQYATAKAGITGLTRTLAIEGQKYNILVNVIAPSAGTAMTETVWYVDLLY